MVNSYTPEAIGLSADNAEYLIGVKKNWIGSSAYMCNFNPLVSLAVKSMKINLLSSAETIFNRESNSPGFTTTTTYHYENPAHKQLTRTTVAKSNGDEMTTTLEYAEDLSNGSATLLKSHFMHSIPLREQTSENNIITSTKEFDYQAFNGRPLLKRSWLDAKGGDNLEQTLEVMQYDPESNIEELKTRDGLRSTYRWSYHHSLPVIKAVNADSNIDDIITTSLPPGYTSLEELTAALDDIATNGAKKALWAEFNTNLRSHSEHSGTLIYTYTYLPLIGMTSQTGPNGQTTYYRYNTHGRLALTRDHEGHILERYQYQYQLEYSTP